MSLTIRPGYLAARAHEQGHKNVADLSRQTGIAPARLAVLADGHEPTAAEVSRLVLSLPTTLDAGFMRTRVPA